MGRGEIWNFPYMDNLSGDVWERAYVTDSGDCRIGLVEL